LDLLAAVGQLDLALGAQTKNTMGAGESNPCTDQTGSMFRAPETVQATFSENTEMNIGAL
jgi:hypothetical protein